MSLVPFDDRDGWIWLDGGFVPWRDANLHVLSHALHYGSSVFEGARMYDGSIFELEAHTARLFRSAELLDFEIPYTQAEISRACLDACAKNGHANCYVRPIAWRAAEQLSVSALATKTRVAIAAWEWPRYFDTTKLERGVRLCWARYRRPPAESAPTEAKAAGLYMICTASKNAAERAGYDDALMRDCTGAIAETTGANIFFVRNGVLFTPTADCFLNGITRQTVIALACEQGTRVNVRRIRPEELPTFTECFIVGTAAEITPVAAIAEHCFKPGAVTMGLVDRYAARVRAREPAPALASA